MAQRAPRTATTHLARACVRLVRRHSVVLLLSQVAKSNGRGWRTAWLGAVEKFFVKILLKVERGHHEEPNAIVTIY